MERGENLPLLLILLVTGASGTPEEFLVQLARSSDPGFWVETRPDDGPSPDSIVSFLQDVSNLTVTPGPRIMEQTEGGYRVVFPECRWRFRRAGRIHSVRDTTCVEWTSGGFRWTRLPLFDSHEKGLDPMKGLCGGLLLFGGILGFTVILLVSVRRKYRE